MLLANNIGYVTGSPNVSLTVFPDGVSSNYYFLAGAARIFLGLSIAYATDSILRTAMS